MESKISVGRVFSTTFGIYFKRLPQLALLTAIVYLPLFVLTLFESSLDDYVSRLIQLPISTIAGLLLEGTITVSTFHELRGQGFLLGRGVRHAAAKLAPLLGLSILTSLMVLLGTVLLVVPGVIAFCAIYVAVPAMLTEDTGVGDAVQRSFKLTKGTRWRILGLTLLLGLTCYLPAFFAVGMIGAVAGVEAVTTNIFSTFVMGMAGTAFNLAPVIVYYQLRESVDGMSLDDLAGVFA